LPGLQLHVVADADGGHDEADLGGELPADGGDAFEQVAALGGVDQRDQPVADLQLDRIDFEELSTGGGSGRGLASAAAASLSVVRRGLARGTCPGCQARRGRSVTRAARWAGA
jgi:hypothetical protein